MHNMHPIIFATVVFIIILLLRDNVPFIGRLPGDFYICNLYVPVTSMLIVSLILSLISKNTR